VRHKIPPVPLSRLNPNAGQRPSKATEQISVDFRDPCCDVILKISPVKLTCDKKKLPGNRKSGDSGLSLTK